MSTATLESPVSPGGLSSDINSSSGLSSQIVSFRLANEEYGVEIMQVQEIILIGQITEMPNVPEHVRGLINLRGHVIAVLDLRTRFGLGTAATTDDSRIIVLNVEGKTIGVIVDAVNEVLRIHVEQIEDVSSGFHCSAQSYVRGLVKFEDKLVVLLNITGLLREEEGVLAE